MPIFLSQKANSGQYIWANHVRMGAFACATLFILHFCQFRAKEVFSGNSVSSAWCQSGLEFITVIQLAQWNFTKFQVHTSSELWRSMEDNFVSMENIGVSTDGGESRADDGASTENSCGGQRTVQLQLNRNCIMNWSHCDSRGGCTILAF